MCKNVIYLRNSEIRQKMVLTKRISSEVRLQRVNNFFILITCGSQGSELNKFHKLCTL